VACAGQARHADGVPVGAPARVGWPGLPGRAAPRTVAGSGVTVGPGSELDRSFDGKPTGTASVFGFGTRPYGGRVHPRGG